MIEESYYDDDYGDEYGDYGEETPQPKKTKPKKKKSKRYADNNIIAATQPDQTEIDALVTLFNGFFTSEQVKATLISNKLD